MCVMAADSIAPAATTESGQPGFPHSLLNFCTFPRGDYPDEEILGHIVVDAGAAVLDFLFGAGTAVLDFLFGALFRPLPSWCLAVSV
jgi:hypothetical protein